jgi:hypothetical protein
LEVTRTSFVPAPAEPEPSCRLTVLSLSAVLPSTISATVRASLALALATFTGAAVTAAQVSPVPVFRRR